MKSTNLEEAVTVWRPRHLLALTLAASSVILPLSSCTSAPTTPSNGSTSQHASDRVVAEGSDRLPSETAKDWVTYADHVVVVEPVSQRSLPPAAEEVERGEGVILRRLELGVRRVLWSSESAERPAPDEFTWTAYGWVFSDGNLDNRAVMTGDDEPRLESGHTYIMAIEWDADCDASADDWRGLGDDSTIPYDDAVIGQGELEGAIVEPSEAAASRATVVTPTDPGAPVPSMEDELQGRGAGALLERLRNATPDATPDFAWKSDPGPSERCAAN